MNKEEFLISTNIIYQYVAANEINIYSKKQLEQNYSIKIEDYLSSKLTLHKLLNEKEKLNVLIQIILSIINLHQKNNNKDLAQILRKNLFNNPDLKCIGPIYLTILRMKIENLQGVLNNKNYYFNDDKMNGLLHSGIHKCNQYMEIIDSYIKQASIADVIKH